nr:hypothetical protein GCM10020093_079440 [Planobispora longispora]
MTWTDFAGSPHTELIDGTLVFVSPQTRFHTRMLSLLERALSTAAPAHMRVEREMTVKLGPRQRPEPDVVVLHAHAATDPMCTFYEAADVLLAVEVVSEESAERDRKRKPQLYAEAGIPTSGGSNTKTTAPPCTSTNSIRPMASTGSPGPTASG